MNKMKAFALVAMLALTSSALGQDPVASATGRIEGASETRELGAAIDGVIEELTVREGDRIEAGRIVARIAAKDLEAAVRAAEAAVEKARQAKVRLVRGSRDEERREARARVAAARASDDRARENHERALGLARRGSGPEENEQIARREAEEASAKLEAEIAHLSLVEAEPLPEEVAMADAAIAEASALRDEAAARFEKSLVRSPVSGVVLKRHLEPGEAVSATFPRPIVSVADDSRRRVRVDVDERDVLRVRVGQRIAVSAPALGEAKLEGRVTRLGAAMGRRQVRSGDPAEKSDRDVLQVIGDLGDSAARLPVGLRVAVEFLD